MPKADSGSFRCARTADIFHDADVRAGALPGPGVGVSGIGSAVPEDRSRKVSRTVEASSFLHLGTGDEAREAALALAALRSPPYWERGRVLGVHMAPGYAWRVLEFRLFADRRGQEFVRVQSVRFEVCVEGS